MNATCVSGGSYTKAVLEASFLASGLLSHWDEIMPGQVDEPKSILEACSLVITFSESSLSLDIGLMTTLAQTL